MQNEIITTSLTI